MSEYQKLTSKLHARVMESQTLYLIWCPGCNEPHGFPVRKDKSVHPNWEFNGNAEHPSFTPSLLHPHEPKRCHLILTDGVIQYCSDCHHSLAGQTVPMVDFPLWSDTYV